MTFKDKLNNLLYPSPDSKKDGKYGYKPSFLVKFIRTLAKVIIVMFRLNSNNRLYVEIQQMLDPVIKVKLPNNEKLIFSTGHGRLVWRAQTLLTEEKLMVEWIDSFKKDDIFFDVGANIGGYSLYAAKTKGVKVYAFEPEINNLQTLYSNIYKNRMNDLITPVPIACDDTTALKPFYIREFSKGGALNTVGRKPLFNINEKDMFKLDTFCMNIDDMIKLFKLPYPTKLKIDVDTNELMVTEGLSKTLNYVQEIYIELFDNLKEHKKVMEILKSKGFAIVASEKTKTPSEYDKQENYIFRKG